MPAPRLAGLATLAALAAACSGTPLIPSLEIVQIQAARPTLTAFASERELAHFFEAAAAAVRERMRQLAKAGSPPTSAADNAAAPPPSAGSAAAPSDGESITNTQHAGVDEGGIVKVHGDHLVILRRGRLFTVKIGDDALTPLAHADAFGPGIDPNDAWYDEMLISGDTAIVIGYSYQRGGTEIGLFDLGAGGAIAHRATYHLSSGDYYSSRNYTSRIVDGKLVFYTPSYLNLRGGDPMAALPAVRRWRGATTEQGFQRILRPTDVYRPLTGFPAEALHTVTVCDLAARDMACKATGVLGPAGRTFYVSGGSVYVWATSWIATHGKSMVMRLPLDGAAPSAVTAKGAPVDQFSFLERDGHLNVLLRGESSGDAMWSPEATAGDVALMRVPLALFTPAGADVPAASYAPLPKPGGFTMQNRFVGDHVLYGAGNGWGHAQPGAAPQVYVYPYAGGAATTVKLAHPVDRIEALGRDAIVVGGDGKDLHFSTVSLGTKVALGGRYVRNGASQGELRSHGFFYKPEAGADDAGVLGLPVRSAQDPGGAHLVEGSASIAFLRNRGGDLSPLGELAAGRDVGLADGCRASCVDWYGNARPIFVRGRVVALMGYELVEGTIGGDRIGERRRVSFAPMPAAVTSRR
ncbi:MAG: beta-propeller domain-containing protein [Deltaproteobacteria bacterium]|nr:beta-propeller domain-containing protein [Deltaproteobacteria bacterium]